MYPPLQRHYNNLDFLRLIFTIIVLLYHFIRKMGFWCEGGYSVELFFILSGFFLFKTSIPEQPIMAFVRKKLVRFMPLLVMAVIFQLISTKPTLIGILNTLLLSPVMQHYFLPVAWYINILFWVSLFIFALLKCFPLKTVNLIVGFFVFVCCYVMVSQDCWLAWLKVSNMWSYGLLRGITCTGAGFLLAQISVPEVVSQTQTVFKTIFWSLAEAFLLCWIVTSMFFKPIYAGPFYLFCAMLFLVYLFVLKKGWVSRLLDISIFCRISHYLLAVYLMQGIVMDFIFPYLFESRRLLFQTHPYLMMTVIVAICFLVGIMAHFCIEKPISRFLTRKRIGAFKNELILEGKE